MYYYFNSNFIAISYSFLSYEQLRGRKSNMNKLDCFLFVWWAPLSIVLIDRCMQIIPQHHTIDFFGKHLVFSSLLKKVLKTVERRMLEDCFPLRKNHGKNFSFWMNAASTLFIIWKKYMLYSSLQSNNIWDVRHKQHDRNHLKYIAYEYHQFERLVLIIYAFFLIFHIHSNSSDDEQHFFRNWSWCGIRESSVSFSFVLSCTDIAYVHWICLCTYDIA